MSKLITLFFKYYCYITTGTLIIVALGFTGYDTTISYNTLWEVLISAFPTTIATILAYNVKADNPNLILRMGIHYVCLCIIMGFLGWKFGWISLSLPDIGLMCISVALVYAFTYLLSWLSDRENAKNINKALEEKYK